MEASLIKRISFLFCFSVAFLLIAVAFAVADTTEEAEETVDTPPKKSPIKIGGQCV